MMAWLLPHSAAFTGGTGGGTAKQLPSGGSSGEAAAAAGARLRGDGSGASAAATQAPAADAIGDGRRRPHQSQVVAALNEFYGFRRFLFLVLPGCNVLLTSCKFQWDLVDLKFLPSQDHRQHSMLSHCGYPFTNVIDRGFNGTWLT